MQITQELTNAAQWALVLGFIQPIVLNFLIQSKWSARTQSVFAFLFSIVVGVATAYFAGAFDNVTNVISIALLVAVVSIAAYRGFWKSVTPDLKEATSINGAHEITSVK